MNKISCTPQRRASGLLGLLGLLSAACQAAPDMAGRWEGEAGIPGGALAMVVDLANGAGSVTLPGRGVKGAPLADLMVEDNGLRFTLAAAFSIPQASAPAARLRWQADGSLAGSFSQAGLEAPLSLRRTGPPQVDRPVPGTAVSPELTGTWRGRYELGGYPREVTLTLANQANGLGGGELLIVGKRTTRLPLDRVRQARGFLTLDAAGADIRVEGRWQPAGTGPARFDGQVVQGPFEAALTLTRDATGGRP
ncbi:MAG: hypothetical protein IV094_14245 [Vitreoscilla sp.]|nr:hypothetical protein [Vitreoscilla sp.]